MSFACNGAAGPAFDTALASFAAHHLKSAEEKGRFLAGVRRHLKPGGTLYVVDVFRPDGVSRTRRPCLADRRLIMLIRCDSSIISISRGV